MNQYIAESAKIGEGTVIGFNTIVLENVTIGADCQIGHNVVIHRDSVIGHNVRIDDNTIIGKKPMRSPRSIFTEEESYKPAVIGDRCLIGTNVIIYVQAAIGEKNLIADLATI
jgi:UDP-3-O-[3-hydroxymyristoyl] glucosamine N-acyltransferase